jgi:hypothetical protein
MTMGLDCSHDAFHGAYGAFNRLRQEVCRAIGGSFPPHWKYAEDGSPVRDENGYVVYDREKEDEFWYWGEGYGEETHPGLKEFLAHSDCDGEISPEMCRRVADDLESILPKVEALGSSSTGHIAKLGGYIEVLRKFIAGCRSASAVGTPLRFR